MRPVIPHLGTPYTKQATRVMLLGSGELGKEVLIALQRLGVETIAVDRYDHAPGQQVAHHARTIAMSDPDALRALTWADVAGCGDGVGHRLHAAATGPAPPTRTGGIRHQRPPDQSAGSPDTT